MLRLYSAIIRLIIQGMLASEYVLALGRSEDRFCRLIQLNIKVEGRLQWTVENPQECLFVLCMENAEQVFDLPSCHI